MAKRTKEYREGWKFRETGGSSDANPYLALMPTSSAINGDPTLLALAASAMRWRDGYEDRAEKGFDVTHLPRTPSGAFA